MNICKFIALIVLSLMSNPFYSQHHSNLQKGIDLFYKRAENAKGIEPKAEIIEEAISILEKELLNANHPEKSGLYYLLSLNFKARFVCKTDEEKKAVLTKAIKVAEVLKDKFPNSGPICFEYFYSVGFMDEISGSFKSAKDVFVGIMKTSAEKLITVDSMYNYGAGWKVLGILNYRTPNLGIILKWPDKKYAIAVLEKAL